MKKAPFYKIFFSSIYDLILLLAVLFLFVFLFVLILGESISGIKKIGFHLKTIAMSKVNQITIWDVSHPLQTIEKGIQGF